MKCGELQNSAEEVAASYYYGVINCINEITEAYKNIALNDETAHGVAIGLKMALSIISDEIYLDPTYV